MSGQEKHTPTAVDFATDAERAIYEHYRDGSTRGDLYTYAKRGAAGIEHKGMTPHQRAAWLGGKARALLAKARGES